METETPTNLADRAAERALAESSNRGLLQAHAALTHQLHVARISDGSARDMQRALSEARGLRAQRDVVQAEILRRMGGDQ